MTGTIGSCAGANRDYDGEGYFGTHATSSGCNLAASDPRVSGPATAVFDGVWFPGADLTGQGRADGGFYWGSIEITGPDGTWAGPFTGVDDITLWTTTGAGEVLIWVAQGTGAYTGWTFIAHLVSDLGPLTVNGLIYQGPPPPWEPAASPSPSPATK